MSIGQRDDVAGALISVIEQPEDHLQRVRKICHSFPETVEKLSHGAPTFFHPKGVFAMFVNNHHRDGRVAVWLPAAPGMQMELMQSSPEIFFRPPYVGVKGWIGIELAHMDDEELALYIRDAWKLMEAKRKKPRRSL